MSKSSETRQAFLLTFFDEDKYTELEVNGWWLVKQWNGREKKWQVHIYPKESFKRYVGNRKVEYEGQHTLWT